MMPPFLNLIATIIAIVIAIMIIPYKASNVNVANLNIYNIVIFDIKYTYRKKKLPIDG